MVMELKHNEDSMWKALPSERRNRIRKSQKNGLTASFCEADALEEFYRVFVVNMRDLGSPVHSLDFFKNIMETFACKTKIVLVKYKSNTIGAGLCFFFKDSVSIPWVSSLRKYFKLYPNNILYWEAIKYGCNNGYKLLDFGRSSRGSGTYEFKRQWGARPKQLYWDYFLTNGRKVIMDSKCNNPHWNIAWDNKPSTKKRKLSNFIIPMLPRPLTVGRANEAFLRGKDNSVAIRLWKKMPVSLSRVIGPTIRKSISN